MKQSMLSVWHGVCTVALAKGQEIRRNPEILTEYQEGGGGLRR